MAKRDGIELSNETEEEDIDVDDEVVRLMQHSKEIEDKIELQKQKRDSLERTIKAIEVELEQLTAESFADSEDEQLKRKIKTKRNTKRHKRKALNEVRRKIDTLRLQAQKSR